jgi:hypothetical protein
MRRKRVEMKGSIGGGDAAKFERGKWNSGLPTIPGGHVT